MSSTIKMERDDGGPDAYRCDNCERIWTFDQLDNISDLAERVSPGSPLPAGECPDPDETCGGALCYPVETPKPAISSDSNENWQNDHIQFARLLSEMLATVDFTAKQRAALCESMDLSWAEVGELLDRADVVWQDIKQRTR